MVIISDACHVMKSVFYYCDERPDVVRSVRPVAVGRAGAWGINVELSEKNGGKKRRRNQRRV